MDITRCPRMSALLLLGMTFATQAFAIVISYDYEFDTPSFSNNNLYGSLNAALVTAGPTITGSLSFDTDDAIHAAGQDVYYLFTHSGELDSVGFYHNAWYLNVSTGGIDPLYLSMWKLKVESVGQDFGINFGLHFPAYHWGASANALAFCYYDELEPFPYCGIPEDPGREKISNFQLWRTDIPHDSVPVPATLALFGLGLACLGINRRKLQTHS